MSCLICGTTPTINSHLLPRTFAREVQVGKAHALARSSDDYDHTQSGVFEQDMLCKNCDNNLGKFENIAAQAFRKIRKSAKDAVVGKYLLTGSKGDDILRFAAGTLWKYSVSSEQNGRIDLGPYRDILRDIAFNQSPIPASIDALLFRLKTHDEDDGVFAYRTPKSDRQEGVNGYRLLVGGMLIFIKTDKQNPKSDAYTLGSIRGKTDLPYIVLPAQEFEEFRKARDLVQSGPLSAFLDKQAQ
ncbi:hypothetical protein PS865_02587 [Pseudomonas fluorescens]|uniref:hypothetical protein n=1 Tax=Pseudomonas fluorescens TaxID=294 RepID=UPI00124028A0|nr:hypothetical protein [Pseudomonas fluorescens]VVO95881.1 hypothetical protein PS865_02587 [Pseudomonas fluorescens]